MQKFKDRIINQNLHQFLVTKVVDGNFWRATKITFAVNKIGFKHVKDIKVFDLYNMVDYEEN